MAQPTENRTQEGLSSVQAGDLANQLKTLREQVGFDLDKAAERMHLSRQILVTLENEDFAHLPEPPYVRGYLRSYARLAESDATPLIRTYEILRGADPDAMAKHFAPALNQRSAPRISPDTARLGVIAVLVLLLVLISMIPAVRNWAQSTWESFAYKTQQNNLERQHTLTGAANPGQDSTLASPSGTVTRPDAATTTAAAQTIAADKPPVNNTSLLTTTHPATPASSNTAGNNVGTTVAATTSTNTSNTSETATAPSPSTSSTASTPAASSTTAPATLANGLPNPAVPLAEAAQATSPQPTSNANAAPQVPVSSTTSNTAATTTPDNAATTTPKPNAEGSVDVAVRIEFSQEVWMQIKDAKGKRIFEVLGAPNTVKELNTRTPMTFKIGNAPGIKLFLNGQPYDLTAYTRGSVATFKVE
jgi:cytoskeletal protein RodZ